MAVTGYRRWFLVVVNSQCGLVGTGKRFPTSSRWPGVSEEHKGLWVGKRSDGTANLQVGKSAHRQNRVDSICFSSVSF